MCVVLCFVALNTLIAKLENRIKKSEVSGAKRTGFLRYERKNAEFFHCDPPDGPSWAMKIPNTPTGSYNIVLCVNWSLKSSIKVHQKVACILRVHQV